MFKYRLCITIQSLPKFVTFSTKTLLCNVNFILAICPPLNFWIRVVLISLPSYKMLNTPRISSCYIIWVWVIFMNCLSNISMTIFDMITYLILFCGHCSQIRLVYCNNKVYAFWNLSNSYYLHWLQYVRI